MDLFMLNTEAGHFITWWDHSHTEWLGRTTHFSFKYLESKDTTLGPDILQKYFSPELHFMRHQAFPRPNNSPSTLDSFSTSKQGSVLECNTWLARTSARQGCSKGQVQVETWVHTGSWSTLSPGFRSQEPRGKHGGHSIKRTWHLRGLSETGEWEILAINS